MGFFETIGAILWTAHSEKKRHERNMAAAEAAGERWKREHNHPPAELEQEFHERWRTDKFALGAEMASWHVGEPYWDKLAEICEKKSDYEWAVHVSLFRLLGEYCAHFGYEYRTISELDRDGYFDAMSAERNRKGLFDQIFEDMFTN